MRRLLGVALVSLATLSPTWAMADDQAIAQSILQKLQENKDSGKLKGFDINLDVEEGTVWMQGKVASEEQHALALNIARRVSGVTQVVDDMTVAAPAKSASKTTSTRTKASEGGLVNTLKSNMVRLTGSTSKGGTKIVEVAAQEKPAPAATDCEALVQTIAGRLQEAKKAGKLRSFNLDIQCDAGTVWMNGTVASPEQRTLVLETVRRVPGVVQVVNGLKVEQVAKSEPTPAVKPIGAGVQMNAIRRPQAAQVESLMAASNVEQPIASPQPLRAAAPQVPLAIGQTRLAHAAATVQEAPAPVPMNAGAAGGIAPARLDHPSMPGYAWPSYASYPNYAAVTYPKQYSPSAWPYIGPFYPYPQVPLGWRKVMLEWDDGWWYLDFKSK